MPEDKIARLLDLVSYLSTCRAPSSRVDICEKVKGYRVRQEDGVESESVRKMFQRDINDLKKWGIGVTKTPLPHLESADPQFGYNIDENHLYLPYVLQDGDVSKSREPYRSLGAISLSQDDMRVLDRSTKRLAAREELPLSASARSVRRKFSFEISLSPEMIETILATPRKTSVSKTLNVLQRGIADEQSVQLQYHTIERDESKERVIEPYGLFLNWGKWYCAARSVRADGAGQTGQGGLGEATQVFRVDRMKNSKLLKNKTFTTPDEFRVADYSNRPPWTLSSDAGVEVDVRFSFPQSRWVQALQLGEPVEPMDEHGGALIRFDVRKKDPFFRWLLSYRDSVAIESPPELADELTAIKEKILALYADGRDG